MSEPHDRLDRPQRADRAAEGAEVRLCLLGGGTKKVPDTMQGGFVGAPNNCSDVAAEVRSIVVAAHLFG